MTLMQYTTIKVIFRKIDTLQNQTVRLIKTVRLGINYHNKRSYGTFNRDL